MRGFPLRKKKLSPPPPFQDEDQAYFPDKDYFTSQLSVEKEKASGLSHLKKFSFLPPPPPPPSPWQKHLRSDVSLSLLSSPFLPTFSHSCSKSASLTFEMGGWGGGSKGGRESFVLPTEEKGGAIAHNLQISSSFFPWKISSFSSTEAELPPHKVFWRGRKKSRWSFFSLRERREDISSRLWQSSLLSRKIFFSSSSSSSHSRKVCWVSRGKRPTTFYLCGHFYLNFLSSVVVVFLCVRVCVPQKNVNCWRQVRHGSFYQQKKLDSRTAKKKPELFFFIDKKSPSQTGSFTLTCCWSSSSSLSESLSWSYQQKKKYHETSWN